VIVFSTLYNMPRFFEWRVVYVNVSLPCEPTAAPAYATTPGNVGLSSVAGSSPGAHFSAENRDIQVASSLEDLLKGIGLEEPPEKRKGKARKGAKNVGRDGDGDRSPFSSAAPTARTVKNDGTANLQTANLASEEDGSLPFGSTSTAGAGAGGDGPPRYFLFDPNCTESVTRAGLEPRALRDNPVYKMVSIFLPLFFSFIVGRRNFGLSFFSFSSVPPLSCCLLFSSPGVRAVRPRASSAL